MALRNRVECQCYKEKASHPVNSKAQQNNITLLKKELLLRTIKKNKNESSENTALQLINEEFEVSLNKSNIRRAYRTSKKNENNAKIRPVTIY